MTNKNSNHWFVRLFFWSIAAIFVLTIISFLVGSRVTTTRLTVVLALFTGAMLLMKLWNDNRHLRLSFAKLTTLIVTSIILWLPFGFLLVPGIIVVRYVDVQLEREVSYINQQVADKVRQVDYENQRKIDVSVSVWYNPFTWGNTVTKVIRETAVRTVIDKASLSTRLFFGILYAVLRSLQYLYYTGLALAVIRSFGYVLARAAVRRNNRLHFTLPLAR